MNSRCRTRPSRPVSLRPESIMSDASGDPSEKSVQESASASDIAKAVTGRKMSAVEVTETALARIKQRDTILNSFTDVTAERARAKARAIDAAIAAGQSAGPLAGVPFAVKNLFDVEGLPTNGSIRVPSSFCGIFGLKPTYGRLSRARSFPFVASFDHLGPFARSVADLALAYDAMQGADPDDAACTTRAAELVTPHLAQDISGLRIAIAGGHFQTNLFAEAKEAVAQVTKALGATRIVEIPEAARARAAAYVISTTEGASLHLDRLRQRPNDFDPAVRDRLVAGAMIPGPLVDRAPKFPRWYPSHMLDPFPTPHTTLPPPPPPLS